ncbi:hypothetical protein M9H77_00875 [Catharanthus roseus]|uniref:Uncharacterized protein n=1 Tax=Catharanthus roseus TaxID=4058 RepID=A0ACC0C4F4_CATRO|nr:hypothetical protein M9H77_00875 [Catharanthus roseus]
MERGGIWKPNVEITPTCPRCGSTNTKFCYYNNYSLTQPRYFCKGCRRYWTKGGSLRNVPVGGGCRKTRRANNKNHHLITTAATTTATSSIRPSCLGGRMILPLPSSSSAADGVPNIDLALVYANFLNPKPSTTVQATSTTDQVMPPEPLPPLPELSNPNSFRYSDGSGAEETMGMNVGNNIPFFIGELDHLLINNSNYNLPPLPGEETTSEGIWPSSDDLMYSGGGLQVPVHATPSMGEMGQKGSINHQSSGGSLLDVPNYGLFSSGLEK